MLTTVELVQRLVRLRSINPLGAAAAGTGESDVAELLRSELDAGGVATRMEAGPSGRPILIGRVPGPADRAPLVLLSHTDVVPVEEHAWQHDPFGGDIVDGELWGRGSLDMKGTAALHVAAAAALAGHDGEPTRELIVLATPDEEAGGTHGAVWLLDHHPELAGFRDGAPPPEVVSEGGYGVTGILDRPVMPIVLGEKSPLVVRARATSEPGHAALPPDVQAIRAITGFIEAVSGPRAARVHPVMQRLFAALGDADDGAAGRLFRLLASPGGSAAARALAPWLRSRMGTVGHLLSDTVVPTRVEAGYASNVIPGAAEAGFDCRLLPDTDPDEVLAWLARVGRRHGVVVEEAYRSPSPASTPGPLLELLLEVSAGLPSRPVAAPSLTPPVTDLRHFRSRGATGYGWVPIVLTPELLATIHGHDERVPVAQLEHASEVMAEVAVRACTASDPG